MPRKKQGLRVYHHKSKHGCVRCKERRVKCNMQAPACANCTRREELCEYPARLEATDASNEPSGSDATVVPSEWDEEARLQLLAQRIQDERMSSMLVSNDRLLHSIDHVQSDISSLIHVILNRAWFAPSETTMWLTPLSQSAVRYPFLQHSLLSVAHIRQDAFGNILPGISPVAFEHQLAASALFRKDAPTVTQASWVAVLAFYINTLVFQFATQARCADSSFDLTETFKILGSSHAIEQIAGDFLRKTPLWQLILKRTLMEGLRVDFELQANLQILSNMIGHLAGTDPSNDIQDRQAAILQQSCNSLCDWVRICNGNPKRWHHYTHWPAIVHPEFLDLLRIGNDLASLLMIHWCAVMYRSPQPSVATWAQRSGYHTLGRILDRQSWQEILAWPLQVISRPMESRTYMVRPASDAELPDEGSSNKASAGLNFPAGIRYETSMTTINNMGDSNLIAQPKHPKPILSQTNPQILTMPFHIPSE